MLRALLHCAGSCDAAGVRYPGRMKVSRWFIFAAAVLGFRAVLVVSASWHLLKLLPAADVLGGSGGLFPELWALAGLCVVLGAVELWRARK